MNLKKLIALFLFVIAFVVEAMGAAYCQSVATGNDKSVSADNSALAAEEYISRTDDRPNWDDLGMDRILAVSGSTVVAPPTVVRLPYNNPAGVLRGYAACRFVQSLHIGSLSLPSNRCPSGYIYMIQCLRL